MYNFLLVLGLAASAAAHGHHDDISEEAAKAPIDAILWIHILLQAFVWGVLFPIGMVLGMAKSRWHVPLQVSHNLVHSSCTKAYYGIYRAQDLC